MRALLSVVIAPLLVILFLVNASVALIELLILGLRPKPRPRGAKIRTTYLTSDLG
jgi:hypothetical protein